MLLLERTNVAMNLPPPLDQMHVFFAVMSFIFGTLFGSFFNVCIYRVPIKKSIVQPGSHCYHCGTMLAWYDNIPIISYLLLRGNCRSCGIHFSPRYLMVELLTGLLFLAVYLMYGVVWALPFHIAFVGLLIVGTFTDIDHFILPDGITVGGLVFAIIAALLLRQHSILAQEYNLARDIFASFSDAVYGKASIVWYVPFLWSLVGAAFGWTLLAGIGILGRVLFRKEAMGGGDVKLFAFLGAYLGPVNCLWILFLSAILGSCLGLTLLLLHQLFRKDEYEEFELMPASISTTSSMMMAQGTQRDNVVIAESLTAPSEDVAQAEGEPDQENGSISLRIARRTSRQLHHFPYGPYIAVAALIVLLFSREIDILTRQFLFLPLPVREVPTAKE